jgi:hypothetical protein
MRLPASSSRACGGLLVLSMLMAESGSEQQILDLARTSVPSLYTCQLGAAYLLDRGWLATTDSCARPDVRIGLEAASTC